MTEQEYAEFLVKDTLAYAAHAAVIYGVALASFWLFVG